MRSNPVGQRAAISILALLLGIGCTTPIQDRHHALYLKWQHGQISEEEYQERLQALRDEEPWGGNTDERWKNEPIIVYPTR